MWIAEGYTPFKESDLTKMRKIAKGYRPLKIVSPIQQQTDMAKALVKSKAGKSKAIRKPARRNKKGRAVPKKKGRGVQKKKGKRSRKSGKKITTRRVKKSIKGRRNVMKDIFS